MSATAASHLGRLYDRYGLIVVLVPIVLSAAFAPLVFFGGFWVALLGLILWGIGYATQDTLFKALIVFSVLMQLGSLPIFLLARRGDRQ